MSDLRAHIAWLIWCLQQGYSAADDRETMTNWLLDDEATLTPSDRDLKRDLLGMADEIVPAVLAPLRAEVEARRDESKAAAVPLFDVPDLADQLEHLGGQYVAYTRVLDLIDKHAREGQ